ncbi:MAG: hypothetical protein WBL31_15715, partial [Ilumatobacteraceae bacterium]
MELTLIFGSIALVAAVAALWWGLTARPSPARGNLFAGLPDHESGSSALVDVMRRLGGTTRRLLPNALVDGLEVNLVQAGYPHGLDLPRLLGIKITLAVVPGVLLLLNGQPLLAVIAGGALYFLPDYWLLSTRYKRQKSIQIDAADIVDQLTICVVAGLGLDAAIARVASTTDGPLTDELRHTMSDIRA